MTPMSQMSLPAYQWLCHPRQTFCRLTGSFYMCGCLSFFMKGKSVVPRVGHACHPPRVGSPGQRALYKSARSPHFYLLCRVSIESVELSIQRLIHRLPCLCYFVICNRWEQSSNLQEKPHWCSGLRDWIRVCALVWGSLDVC
jgi:hypothetical protein